MNVWLTIWRVKMCCVHGNRSDNSGHASQVTDFGEHDWYEDTSTLLLIVCFLQTVSCGCSQLSVEGGMDAHKQAHFWKAQGSSGVVLDLRLPDSPPGLSSAQVAVQGTSTQTSSSLRVNLMSCFLGARLPAPPPHFLSQISLLMKFLYA